jgi:hypothetical protein
MLRLLFCIVKTRFWGRPDQAERCSGRCLPIAGTALRLPRKFMAHYGQIRSVRIHCCDQRTNRNRSA